MKKFLVSIILINLFFISNLAFANEKINLNYNIIPDIPNGYVIDSVHTNKIGFSLFESENTLFSNDESLEILDNHFEIDITGLSGENKFVISNASGEKVEYTYYISNNKGYLDGYQLDGLKNSHKVFIKTVKNVSIIYTNKDSKSVKEIEKILISLPENLLVNLKEIKLIPAKHESKAAGITNYNKITLYKISSYSKTTIKNIVTHEIAHTWAHTLIQNKTLDYSYTTYQDAVNNDKKFPSNYAKENVKDGNYSEDFAESISFYLINTKSFTKKCPMRANYIKELLSK